MTCITCCVAQLRAARQAWIAQLKAQLAISLRTMHFRSAALVFPAQLPAQVQHRARGLAAQRFVGMRPWPVKDVEHVAPVDPTAFVGAAIVGHDAQPLPWCEGQ